MGDLVLTEKHHPLHEAFIANLKGIDIVVFFHFIYKAPWVLLTQEL